MNIHENVLRAMDRPGSNHRDPWFAPFFAQVLEDVKFIFNTSEGSSIIYPGTGTGGWEAALQNTLSPGDKIVTFRYGQFSHLWIDQMQARSRSLCCSGCAALQGRAVRAGARLQSVSKSLTRRVQAGSGLLQRLITTQLASTHCLRRHCLRCSGWAWTCRSPRPVGTMAQTWKSFRLLQKSPRRLHLFCGDFQPGTDGCWHDSCAACAAAAGPGRPGDQGQVGRWRRR